MALSAVVTAAVVVPCLRAADGPGIQVQVGGDVAPAVAARIPELLEAAGARLRVAKPGRGETPASLALAIGECPEARAVIGDADCRGLGDEGFVARSAVNKGRPVIAVRGPGVAFGAYAVLERMGFGFLHPLRPHVPRALRGIPPGLSLRETPMWAVRGTQIHTMHPLELTELLNGWGNGSPDDEAGWRAMLPEWERYLEWALANRQNRVTWVLLEARSWQAFSRGPVRQARLKRLVDRAHAWGHQVGLDVPLALVQQHAWTMIRETGDPQRESTQLRQSIDWLAETGVDFLTTESGFSEFTHPDDRRMLAWMNEATRYLLERHGKKLYIKIHCSTGQYARHFVDPATGQPLNFNFLPQLADQRLGVMPHTVQHYGLDDPAPTYGNRDFSEMERFMTQEAARREVLWHPETAYWVSFDIDVPLFLPLYAERRVHDVRRIARRMPAPGARPAGQLVFSSGWEWGYWLNDAVALRAAWNPHLEATSDSEAFRRVLLEILGPFGDAAPQMAQCLADAAAMQHRVLIRGEVSGRPPSEIEMLNGQAYLQGWETWDEVGIMLGALPGVEPVATQPRRLGLVDMRNPLYPGPRFEQAVKPLLAEVQQVSAEISSRIAALGSQVPPPAREYFDEFRDASRITALRAAQVRALYDYVDLGPGRPRERAARLEDARSALREAEGVVQKREAAYRVPADRIAAWRANPTAYDFTYLWTVRSLHYWRRDEGKATHAPWSPCYMNIVNPVDVAFGEGRWASIASRIRALGERVPGLRALTRCLGEPP